MKTMNKDYQLIINMLRAIHSQIDNDEFDYDALSPNALGISGNRRDAFLEIIENGGLVDWDNPGHPILTLKGLFFMAGDFEFC